LTHTRPASIAVGLRLALFFTGLLGIGYEVVAIRLLARVLENTIYTFTVALAVYLLGTALGATFYQKFIRSLPTKRIQGWLLFGVAASCATGVVVLATADGLYGLFRVKAGAFGGITAEFVVCASAFLLPTIAMGALFSHLVQTARLA